MRVGDVIALYFRDQKLQSVLDQDHLSSPLRTALDASGDWEAFEAALLLVWEEKRFPLKRLREETIDYLHAMREMYGLFDQYHQVLNPPL